MQIKFESQAVECPLGVVKEHIKEGVNQTRLIDLELASSASLKTDCCFYSDQSRIVMKVAAERPPPPPVETWIDMNTSMVCGFIGFTGQKGMTGSFYDTAPSEPLRRPMILHKSLLSNSSVRAAKGGERCLFQPRPMKMSPIPLLKISRSLIKNLLD